MSLFCKLCELEGVAPSVALREFISAALKARRARVWQEDTLANETRPATTRLLPRAQFEKELKSALKELHVEAVNAARVPEVRRLCFKLDIDRGTCEKQLIDAWQRGMVKLEEGSSTTENDTLRYRGRSYLFVKL